MVNPLLFHGATWFTSYFNRMDGAIGERGSWNHMLCFQPPPLSVGQALQFAVVENYNLPPPAAPFALTHKDKCKVDTVGELLKAFNQKLADHRLQVLSPWAVLEFNGVPDI